MGGARQLVEREAGQHETEADEEGGPGLGGGRRDEDAAGIGRRALGYTPIHLSARSRRPYQQPVPGPAAGESARAGEQARVRVRDAIVPLGVLLALGLALRLIIAYVLLPGSGFKVDLGSFSGWAMELARNGPWGLYDRPVFVDYTPGYIYVLWGLGLLAQATGIAIDSLLKLPAIVADLGLAVAIFALAAELGATRRGALAAAGVFLLVPVTWFDSAVWAQVDSVGTLFLVLAVRDLWRGRSERAAVLTTIAAIIKPQFGILIPLAAVVIVRRHWVERPDDGSRLGGGPIRIATTTIAGLVTATLVCLPFGITIVGLLQQIVETAGGYPYITVNAYNPWALVTMDGSGLAASGTWIRDAPNPERARPTRSSRCSGSPRSSWARRSSAPPSSP